MIVYFGGTAYDGVAGTDRQLADRLNALTPVLYVDPPVSVLTPLLHPHLAPALRGAALRREATGVWRLRTRVLPGAYRPGMHHISSALVRRAARKAARRTGEGEVGAVIIGGTSLDVVTTVPGARTLYHLTDDLVAGAELLKLPRRRLAAALDRTVARADVVAVVSTVLRDQCRERGRDAELVPNGCAPEAYEGIDAAPWPDDVPHFDGRPPAGFAGHINARIDLGLLEAVADAGHPLVLVGPHDPDYQPERFRALCERPRVRWTGRKPFAEMPAYLGTIRVGLTPYLLDDFNRASFPIKTLDYLAAGRAVVSTDLPATTWLRGEPDGADLVRSEATAEGFVRAVGEELAAPAPSPDLVARRRAFAGRHSWTRRAHAVAELLDIDPVRDRRQEVPAP